jgi:hypothetical protein
MALHALFQSLVTQNAIGKIPFPSFSRRGGCEADGVVVVSFTTPTTPPASAGTPPPAGGENIDEPTRTFIFPY